MLILGLLAIVIGILLATAPARWRGVRHASAPDARLPAGPTTGEADGPALADAPDAMAEADDDATVEADDEPPPRALQLGDTYTRGEIHAMLGGGMQDYLPHVDGRVVCGCFHPGYNPYAPFVVLPGLRPSVQRWAVVLAEQDAPVPCFLKRAANTWEYVGEFRVAHLSRDPDEIAEWARIAEREDDVSMVLHLEEVRAGDDD